MNEHYSLEELEAYLYGELEPERKKDLEERIQTDLSLEKELAALKISRAAVELAGWKSVIAQSQKEFLSEREQAKIKPIQSGRSGAGVWLSRIAASATLILVGALAVLFFSTNPESITDKQVGYVLPVMRSSAAHLASLELAYQNEDYMQVLELAKGISDYDSKTWLLIGLANLETNNGVAAEEYLIRIETENQKTSSREYADQVDYYLVKTYLMQGKIIEAEERIIKISKDQSHTYHDNFSQLDLIQLKILKLKN